MFSLAMTSFWLCSAAISSSTGATILHGPHHSAQKSTSTGLSLPSTSVAKLASVTVTVLPAIGRSPSRWTGSHCPAGGTARGGVYSLDPYAARSALVEGLGDPALGVDRGGGPGARRGDRLPVDVVDHVTAGEDTVDVGARARVLDLDVTVVVQLELTGEQLAARIVPDRDEQSGHRHGLRAAVGHDPRSEL